jgi:hypothetical protein
MHEALGSIPNTAKKKKKRLGWGVIPQWWSAYLASPRPEVTHTHTPKIRHTQVAVQILGKQKLQTVQSFLSYIHCPITVGVAETFGQPGEHRVTLMSIFACCGFLPSHPKGPPLPMELPAEQ